MEVTRRLLIWAALVASCGAQLTSTVAEGRSTCTASLAGSNFGETHKAFILQLNADENCIWTIERPENQSIRIIFSHIHASTSFLVVSPPVVMGRGCPVGNMLHIAGPIAAPPVTTMLTHLVMESVVDRYVGACQVPPQEAVLKLQEEPLQVRGGAHQLPGRVYVSSHAAPCHESHSCCSRSATTKSSSIVRDYHTVHSGAARRARMAQGSRESSGTSGWA
ncbi:hypothetical protein ACRRTK_011057 [Alexandromys fortis]